MRATPAQIVSFDFTIKVWRIPVRFKGSFETVSALKVLPPMPRPKAKTTRAIPLR